MKKTFLKAILALAASFAFVFTSCSVDSSHDSPPNTHTVKFMNGDVVYETQTVEDGETATKPETDPTKEGFTFLDWYKDGEAFDFFTPIKEDITLTAEWQDPDKEYVTVTFKKDDGSVPATKKIEKGQKVSKPTDPVKAGHTFDGWYTESGTMFDFNTPINEDITLTAKWNVASVPVQSIKITGAESVAKGGSVRLSATVTPGNATNRAIVWSVKNETEAEGVTVANGTVTVSADCAATSVIIRAVSAADESVSDEHTLRIIDVSAINAGITITKEEGWLESSYIEWSKVTSNEIDGYNVYVREAGEADDKYVKLDDMLVRAYSNTAGGTTIDYYRADALGLKAGTYQMKVVGTASGIEAENVYAESKAITVEAHTREGFAFVNGTASGAYKEDGTLKDGAIILYVTNENWQTVSVTYSGTTVTGIDNILGEGYKSNKGATKPLCVRIIGSIGNGNKLGFKAGGDLEMKALDQGVTIEGVGNDATANGWGLHITTASNVEVRNLAFMEMQGTTKDGVSIESKCHHIWVHNCDFFYGHNWGGDQKKGDGSLDTKSSTNITHSYNHFWDSGKCNLQNMHESGDWRITYHHNWYDHSDSRHPRVRSATVHVYNNYFDGNAKYSVGATEGCSIFVENNYFRSTATMRPMLSSMQGTDAKGDGTFSSEDGGMIKAFGNKYDCNASNLKLITQKDTTDKTDIDCYEADSRNEQVPGEYKTKKGGTTYNNFDTASDFYSYTADTPEDAKANVEKYAGRMNGGDLHHTFNNAVEDSNYDIITELANKIKNYASKLVKAMGSSSAGGSDGDGDGNESDVPTEPTPPVVVDGEIVYVPETDGTTKVGLTISGNVKKGKASATIDGVTYNNTLEFESSTSISFTAPADKDYVLKAYLSGASIKNNNTAAGTGDFESKTGYYIYTCTVAKGTTVTLSKNNTVQLFKLVLTPSE